MTARILIVDATASDSIVTQVKLQPGQFHITTCTTRHEAEVALTENRPDLILISPAGLGDGLHAFCRALRENRMTRSLGIIVIGIADTAKARFAAIDAGADDVLPNPVDAGFLLARIRALLRIKSNLGQMAWHDGAARAFGFDDARRPFARALRLAYVTQSDGAPPSALLALSNDRRIVMRQCSLHDLPRTMAFDAVVLDLQNRSNAPSRGANSIAQLSQTIKKGLLVIVPKGDMTLAARCLDLGAGDVAFDDIGPDECARRIARLASRADTRRSVA